MAELLVNGICRYAVNGLYEGHVTVNIVDMKIDTTGSVDDRGEACFDQAGVVLNNWDEHFLPLQVVQWAAQSVSWIDLDSLDGSVGERTTTDEATWPAAGENSSDGFPGAVALRANKNTISKRGERQGRMYICGVAEGYSSGANPNEIVAGNIGEWNTALEGFLDGIEQTPDEIPETVQYSSEFHVVHAPEDQPTSSTRIRSFTCDQFLRTQVRRGRR